MMQNIILQAAKAVVAFLVPLIVVFFGEKLGLDIDPLQLETLLVSFVTALTVYFTPNQSAE